MISDTDDEPIRDGRELAKAWLDALESASDEEKDWREDADKAVKAYRGEDPASRAFNLFHANIETIVPALYNSVPAPDVRRRYLDPDPVAKVVADIIERGLSYSIDAYDFDAAMNACVRDMAITGRGIERVRYKASFGDDDMLEDEEVVCEYVPWRSFRHGPGRLWSDVTWVAFEHFLDKATIEARVPPEVFQEIPFDHSASATGGEDNKDSHKEPPRFGKRARVWEIWDKEKREVHFIAADYTEKPLWTVSDPLELEGFFPVPRPMQAINTTDSLIPVASYTIYESLLKELNEVSSRIAKLVRQLRPRGGYVGGAGDFKAITEADDGELVPLDGAEMFIQSGGGGLDKAITWFPLEPTIQALRELVQHREMIKQNIYEVTKIADVMRGVSKPNETLGAQNLKAEWGSLAIQRMQSEVARFARDLFRLKAEIMTGKMDFDRLLLATGIKLPTEAEKQQAMAEYEAQKAPPQAPQAPQGGEGMGGEEMGGEPPPPAPEPPQAVIDYYTGPSREEVEQMLRTDAVRGYHIDIESDSTIRADLGRQQEQMGNFLGGVQQFGAALGPMIEQGAMPMEVAIEIFSAFARRYKLGKQAEDALDQWADNVKTKGGAKPEADPAAAEAQAAAQAEQAKAQADQAKAQADAEAAQAKLQAEMQMKQAEMQAKGQSEMAALQARGQENAAKAQGEQERLKFEREKAQAELGLKARELSLKEAAHNQQLVGDAGIAEREEEEMRDRMAMEAMQQALQLLANAVTQQTQTMAALVKAQTAPKRVVRDSDGRAVGVETATMN